MKRITGLLALALMPSLPVGSIATRTETVAPVQGSLKPDHAPVPLSKGTSPTRDALRS
jgi:hypothetical protein